MFSDISVGYYERLRKFGLTTLETRRLWGDIIIIIYYDIVHKVQQETNKQKN